MRIPRGGAASGAQPFATTRTARRNHAPAAFRSHAGAEAVPALAYQLARLIGPLHGSVSASRGRLQVRPPISSEGSGAAAGPKPKMEQLQGLSRFKVTRLIREHRKGSQCGRMSTINQPVAPKPSNQHAVHGHDISAAPSVKWQ